MDLVLEVADRNLLTPYVYPSSWPESDPFRQLLSLFVLTNLGAIVLYLLFCTLSYYFIFDHKLMKHPQFLEVGVLHAPTLPHPSSVSPASLWTPSGWRPFQTTHASAIAWAGSAACLLPPLPCSLGMLFFYVLTPALHVACETPALHGAEPLETP